MLTTLLAFTTFLLGLAAGAAAMFVYNRHQQAGTHTGLRDTFNALAAQALQTNAEQFLQLANEKLEQARQATSQELTGKQSLIDQRLATIQAEVAGKLEKVTTLVTEIDKNRHASFTNLQQQLGTTGEQLKSLQTTTADLKSALTNSRTRGQWGERMAEDVLRMAGLQPEVNYRRQSNLLSETGTRGRPDYTFLLPGDRVIHMDVKFPLDNYLAYLNAETEAARTAAARQFVTDAKARLRETAARDYRNGLTENGEQALEYLLIFIPNEQVYAFLIENAPDLLNDALAQKIILTSPTTLLAVLAVVNQAAQHFRLQQQAAGIHDILNSIRQQWDNYVGVMGKMGEKLDDAQKQYQLLTTTRTNMLERQFAKLDTLPSSQDAGPTLLNATQPLTQTQ
ncbi:MAG: DNA recombination protein RmuC [Pseudomonas fluorescens]|nr:MAG: DNA recombination protein RmuC [Pseudomonas fluorescens]